MPFYVYTIGFPWGNFFYCSQIQIQMEVIYDVNVALRKINSLNYDCGYSGFSLKINFSFLLLLEILLEVLIGLLEIL